MERSFLRLFWILALLGVGLDQAGKYGVFSALYANGAGDIHDPGARFYSVVPDKFELRAKFTNLPDDGSHVFSALRTLGTGRLPDVNKGALFGWLNESEIVSPETAHRLQPPRLFA